MEADYFDIESGNKNPHKFENSGLTAEKSEFVDAPVINEFPLCLECEFIEFQGGEYDCGVIGKVVNAIASAPYTHGYYKVNERVGNAFKDGLQLKNK